MANWRSTRTPSVYVAHSRSRPAHEDADARCRCRPSWRGRRRDPITGKPTWSKTMKDRGQVLVWMGSVSKGADHLAELAARGPTFGSLGDEWLDGVERGRIGRRRRRGKPYSETTIASMRRRWECKVRPEFGDRFASELTEMDWQRWIDQLTRQGLSRSSIAQLISLASGIYAWAAAPSRRLVQRNPLRLVELPPNDEKPRMRVALVPEAAALLAALEFEDRLPYAIAFYAGLRRSELYRLEWPDVLDDDRIATRIHVMKSKSDARTHRRPPIADNLRSILAAAWDRRGRPSECRVVDRSVMSGNHADREHPEYRSSGAQAAKTAVWAIGFRSLSARGFQPHGTART